MCGTSDHIKPLRLFDIARDSGSPTTDEEKTHLRECVECQHIIEVFARQFEKPLRPRTRKDNDAA
jgi:hypothetical protein